MGTQVAPVEYGSSYSEKGARFMMQVMTEQRFYKDPMSDPVTVEMCNRMEEDLLVRRAFHRTDLQMAYMVMVQRHTLDDVRADSMATALVDASLDALVKDLMALGLWKDNDYNRGEQGVILSGPDAGKWILRRDMYKGGRHYRGGKRIVVYAHEYFGRPKHAALPDLRGLTLLTPPRSLLTTA